MTIDEERRAKLAAEARAWADGTIDPKDWIDSPEAIPRKGESTTITMRIPTRMLLILKEFAHRRGVAYQKLMKHWLDEKIRSEAERVRRSDIKRCASCQMPASSNWPGGLVCERPMEHADGGVRP